MFHSLDDYKGKKETNEDKDKKKTTESYTGGKSSGMAVENPENKEAFDKQSQKCSLKVYKNGFFLDDGPFRPITEEPNKKFMAEIDKGFIPKELVDKGYKELGIAIENHKETDYTEPIPEKKFEAFTGSGMSIGKVDMKGLAVNKNASNEVVDKSKPVCKINIRLFNGETVNEMFNLTNTLKDVWMFVEKASGSKKFQLLDGFPPKPLMEMGKTIAELKIQGSTLTQKIG